MSTTDFALWADLLLLFHALIALFITLGLLAILLGWWRHWAWPQQRGFRRLHLIGILFIAVEAWLGAICPLTEWEQDLRLRAGQVAYDGGFIAHWVGEMLFYNAPLWLFGLIYTGALGLTLLAWWRYPAKPR